MNAWYNQANRLKAAIAEDCLKLRSGEGGTTAGLQGAVAVSLVSFNTALVQYGRLAEGELVAEKKRIAYERIAILKKEGEALKDEFENAKTVASDREAAQAKMSLMGGTGSGTSRSRTSAGTYDSPNPYEFRPNRETSSFYQPKDHNENSRATFALKESDFLTQAESSIDQYLAQGRAALSGLTEQRAILKGTQKRLLSAANTMGLSRNVISFIEKRSRQDMKIFWAGLFFTILAFFLIHRYLG